MSKLGADLSRCTFDEYKFVMGNLRDADKAEVEAAYGLPASQMIDELWEFADGNAYAGRWNGKPVCVMGAAKESMLYDNGLIWMLGTPEIDKIASTFLRHSIKWVRRQSEKFSLLYNYVDARNVKSIKWLRWLGFQLDEPAPYGVRGLPFHRFELRGKV